MTVEANAAMRPQNPLRFTTGDYPMDKTNSAVLLCSLPSKVAKADYAWTRRTVCD